VLIPSPKRRTLCVSSQVGCSLACKFCHTGTQKLERNLQTSEIVGQFLLAEHASNLVFMGQGEPLYNWRNVSRAVQILTDAEGIALGKQKITISTSGIAPLIPKIATELGVNLAVSLHAPIDDLRTALMPINKTYDLAALIDSCKEYISLSPCATKRISFEYVMLDGVNDDLHIGKDLLNLLHDIPSHINLM
jgi:23S rRNA (adenine2503-C2)-methyltransferase